MWYIQTMEYYWGIKRTQSSGCKKMWRKLQCILLSERSQSEKATYYMIPTTWYYGKSKIRKAAKEISGCQGLGDGRGWIDHRGFGGRKNTLCDSNTITMGMRHFMCIQTHWIYNAKSEPWCNYGLWVTTMCQSRLISWNKRTTMVGHVDSGGGLNRSREYMENLCPSWFCWEPKNILKK